MKASFMPVWMTRVSKLTAVAVLGALAGCQPQKSPEMMLADNIPLVVKPFYDNLSVQFENLQSRTESYCRSPGVDTQRQLKEAWKQAMAGWQAASVVNFGPISEGSMSWKFQFWPDKKNLIQQRVEKAVTSDKTWNLTTIGKASVVARGMGASEYLLFDKEYLLFDKESRAQLADNPVRCQYLGILAADMARNAKRLSKGWQKGPQRYPAELTALASDAQAEQAQVSGLLIHSLYSSLELAYKKLALPAGNGGTPNPYLAESWRSDTSLHNTLALLAAAEKLYKGGEGYGLDDSLKQKSETGRLLAKEIEQAFTSAQQAVPVDESFTELLVSGSPKTQQLLARVAHVKDLFGKKVPEVLEIPLGFNANDGD